MRNYGLSHYEQRVAKAKAAARKRVVGDIFFIIVFLALALVVMVLAVSLANSRDLDGRFAGNPLHAWFDSLASGRGLCCSFADGESVQDVDWQTQDGKYQVRLEGKWFTVPADAVVSVANRFGPAVVWPIRYQGAVYDIRCFMPGAGT